MDDFNNLCYFINNVNFLTTFICILSLTPILLHRNSIHLRPNEEESRK